MQYEWHCQFSLEARPCGRTAIGAAWRAVPGHGESGKEDSGNVKSDSLDPACARLQLLQETILSVHMDECPLQSGICDCERLVLEALRSAMFTDIG